ncbi:MAG: hypothetical protein AVDCRST_MAG56-828 [uncultured Cytophagales bacterium]|uniref:Uncharacterized protein n=1 Tax=uncultured Cytophagales bacterium TaxID=158755 RepID=A0A6J4HPD6_9SPHI|nr:MAG: hypothetical protein AVDCRST_MAG56-828 [uncultured Cytophagales bacterium]
MLGRGTGESFKETGKGPHRAGKPPRRETARVPEKRPFCAAAPPGVPFGKIPGSFPGGAPEGPVTCRPARRAFSANGGRGKSVKREGVAVKKARCRRCGRGSWGAWCVIFAHSPIAVPFFAKEEAMSVFFRRNQPFRPDWG